MGFYIKCSDVASSYEKGINRDGQDTENLRFEISDLRSVMPHHESLISNLKSVISNLESVLSFILSILSITVGICLDPRRLFRG
jgi:hypothetical protein